MYRGQTITYDEIGNPLSYYNGSSYIFTWQNGRQLATAVKGSRTLSFEYNDEGIRTSKTVNGVEHVYYLNGSQILAESWGSVLCVYLYDANGSPIGMQYRTTSYAEGVFDTFWFTKNVQGDIVSVYNNSGTKLLTYHYDAWGNVSTQWHTYTGSDYNASYNPFKYRGYYHDSETGFYYLNSRYYDPATGRFLNADGLVSTGQGLLGYNMYAYCNNNPVNCVDFGGNIPIPVVIAIAVGSFVAGLAIGAVAATAILSSAVVGSVVGFAKGCVAGAALKNLIASSKEADTDKVDEFLAQIEDPSNDNPDCIQLPVDTQGLLYNKANREYAAKKIKGMLGSDTNRTIEDISAEIFAHQFAADVISPLVGILSVADDYYKRFSKADIDEGETRLELYKWMEDILEWE